MSSSNFKLSGINSLSYVGVQASTPPQLLYVNRAPTANDYRLILPGTLWLYVGQPNNTPIQLYMAATVIPNNATWILLYPASSGGAEEFVTDSGTATPSGGIINVKGGSNINTQATFPNNVIINLDSTVSLSGSLSVADNVTFTGVGEGVLQASILGAVTGSRGTNGQVLIGDTGLPPVWNNITSSDGSITITNGAGTINLGVTNGPTGVIITIFTSSGTWTPNSSTSSTTIYGFAGGGGGGSGQRNTVNASSGGGGGAPGGGAKVDFGGPVTTGPVSITIGAGGVGGAAVTTDSTLGNYGMNGGATTVGTYYTFGYQAEGGQAGGGGGTTTATTGGPTFPAGAPGVVEFPTNIGRRFAGAGIPTLLTDIFGNQANDAILQTVPLIGTPINLAPGTYTAGLLWFPGIPQASFGVIPSYGNAGTPMGGGGGSGATTVPFRGGYGGTYGSTGTIATGTIYITPANGGIQGGTINGTNGLSYTQTATDAAAFGPGAMVWGTGGGGGGGSNSGVAGNGGNGGLGGGGGGGGGGSVNGNNSGAGGTGGNGVVIIFEFL